MCSVPRGKAVIINNQKFDDPETFPFRLGANVDTENLEQLFSQLSFEVIKYENLRRNETMKIMIDLADTVGCKESPCDMLIGECSVLTMFKKWSAITHCSLYDESRAGTRQNCLLWLSQHRHRAGHPEEVQQRVLSPAPGPGLSSLLSEDVTDLSCSGHTKVLPAAGLPRRRPGLRDSEESFLWRCWRLQV